MTLSLEESSTRRVFDLCPLPLIKGKGKILKRGAVAPLRHPYIINPEQEESKGGEASLIPNLNTSFNKTPQPFGKPGGLS